MLTLVFFLFFYRFANENIQAPVLKRAKANKQVIYRQSTLSWKTDADVDTIPQTLRFRPARETGAQLTSADSHSPMSLFKLFFQKVLCQLCATIPTLRLARQLQKDANINGQM